MLSHWAVENFKSINGRIELGFAPITIFAGANSSGKSTILHSILLAKQTVRYAPAARSLALNGPILKLGFFDEVKNGSASVDDQIGIGFRFDLTQTGQSFNPVRLNDASENFLDISVEARFSVAGSDDVARLHPILSFASIRASHIPTEPENEEDAELIGLLLDAREDFTIAIDSPASDSSTFTGPATHTVNAERRSVFRVAQVDAETRNEVCEDKANSEIVGAKAKHFLPHEFVVQYDLNKTRAERVVFRLCSLNVPARLRYEPERIPSEAFDYLTAYLIAHGFTQLGPRPQFVQEEVEKSISLTDAVSFIRESYRANSERLTATTRVSQLAATRAALQDPDLQTALQQIVFNRLGPKLTRDSEATSDQNSAARYVDAFFAARTKYIGPLRDEPKPLYPLEEVADAADVGYHGEHTAAVLELNRQTLIRYVAPQDLTAGPLGRASYDLLPMAVTKWLEYLGVANAVSTSDMGKFGHQMQVRTDEGAKPHDLTNVGVGVSQVLPIVVMALLAPPDSLLIFEQPELHLHPRVQSRLADFFIGMSRLDKQCVIETHSEYLIQRLRRRIAEDDKDALRHHIRAYFVERKAGSSSYKPIEFTEYGAITNWPEDFFDQSDREVEQILLAASRKRAKKKKG